MSTRKRTKAPSTSPKAGSQSPPIAAADSPSNPANRPPPRQKPPMPKVSPPLSSMRLSRLIYILAITTLLLGGYYSWRIAQWKTEVGGWWNLALGKRPPQPYASQPYQTQVEHGRKGWSGKSAWSASKGRDNGRRGRTEDSVEDRINALADALGMPSSDLAAAIAGAVREYVPPATLSSLAAHETETGSGVVDALVNEKQEDHEVKRDANAGSGGGIASSVVNGIENMVGMDEPPVG